MKPNKVNYWLPITVLFVFLTTGCKKENNTVAELTTLPITSITSNTATGGGSVTSDGGSAVISRGVCWKTVAGPTIADQKTVDGAGIGDFSSTITDLLPNTAYHLRAYATNGEGTAYGNEVIFTTSLNTVTDIDGNIYHTVKIGNQFWLVENLKTTKYRNGDLIGTTTPATFDISDETSPKYQWAYDGNENNVATYGRLYTWHASNDTRNICPVGWHIPSDTEWETLIISLGGEEAAGAQLKNINGFNAQMGGYRYYTDHFLQLSINAHWWTSTATDDDFSYKIQLDNSDNSVFKTEFSKNYGLSVRCLRD